MICFLTVARHAQRAYHTKEAVSLVCVCVCVLDTCQSPIHRLLLISTVRTSQDIIKHILHITGVRLSICPDHNRPTQKIKPVLIRNRPTAGESKIDNSKPEKQPKKMPCDCQVKP